jgi:A/G-specific adenine glycosylase
MSAMKSAVRVEIARDFRKRLLRWYGKNQRKLPWRGETDPYRILVSEIMLQQTRVAVVEERYKDFLRRFPTVRRLARAREQTVLAVWSGLGYYRRARSLHAAAKLVLRRRRFPRTSAELQALPGVGRYTANAVASIAFGDPVPVVDGNVQRVLERVLGRALSPEQSWSASGALLDVRRPGDFNQAMMELGAVVCLPGKPLCEMCPVAAPCVSRGTVRKIRRSQRQKASLRYALVYKNGAVLLEQRPGNSSLMPGMWELPAISGKPRPGSTPLLTLSHSITTTDYAVSVFSERSRMSSRKRWVPFDKTRSMALTGLTKKILERICVRRKDIA